MGSKRRLLFAAVLFAMLVPFTASAAPSNGRPPELSRLVAGLAGSQGSTVGPGGDLYVTERTTGTIARVDPKTGQVTTFASGLPKQLAGLPTGGPMDVAFIGKTAYALVTVVGSDVGGTDIVGIYRVDGPQRVTVVADIGAFSMANPPTSPFFVPTGVQYSFEPYRGGFLVADGHHNRVLQVSLDGTIREVIAFGNIVPTGLAISGNTAYLAQAGPVPHLPENGKVVTFKPKSHSPTANEEAAGARLLVDVEFGRGHRLYALSQGVWNGVGEGSPALPNTGSLVQVKRNGTFRTVMTGLNQPTSLEFIRNDAYVVTLGGEIWKIDNVG